MRMRCGLLMGLLCACGAPSALDSGAPGEDAGLEPIERTIAGIELIAAATR